MGDSLLSKAGIKRLHKDLREIATLPSDMGVALIDESCMSQWGVNFVFDKGPFEGAILHLHLTFSRNYPLDPPGVRLMTSWDHHSHIFGQKICFSLIKDFEEYFTRSKAPTTSRWNPAISLRHFLTSLHAFLASDEDDERNASAEDIINNVKATKVFACPDCPHLGTDPVPSIPLVVARSASGSIIDTSTRTASASASARFLIDPLTLEPPECASYIKSRSAMEMADRMYRCFLPHCTNKFAVNPSFGINIKPPSQDQRDVLQVVPCCICASCFEEISSVTHGNKDKGAVVRADTGEQIQAVIPYVVQSDKWPRDLAIKNVLGIVKSLGVKNFRSGPGGDEKCLEEILLDTLGELWKEHALALTKMRARQVEYASESFLQAFIAIYHFLKAEARFNPKLVEFATKSVTALLTTEKGRSKKMVPDFGRFLVRFLVAENSWPSGKKLCNLLGELFARGVFRALLPNPHLHATFVSKENVSREEKSEAIELIWKVTKTGLGLTALQATFIFLFNDVTLADLDANYGVPQQKYLAKFQYAIKSIQHMLREASFSDDSSPTPYADFFDLVKFEMDKDVDSIFEIIKEGVQASLAKGYHGKCTVCHVSLPQDQIHHRFCETHRCSCCHNNSHPLGVIQFCRHHANEFECNLGFAPLAAVPCSSPVLFFSIPAKKSFHAIIVDYNTQTKMSKLAGVSFNGKQTDILSIEERVIRGAFKADISNNREQEAGGICVIALLTISGTLLVYTGPMDKANNIKWNEFGLSWARKDSCRFLDVGMTSNNNHSIVVLGRNMLRVYSMDGTVLRENILPNEMMSSEFKPTRLAMDEKRNLVWILEQFEERISAIDLFTERLRVFFYIVDNANESDKAPSPPWCKIPNCFTQFSLHAWRVHHQPLAPAHLAVTHDHLFVILRQANKVRYYSIGDLLDQLEDARCRNDTRAVQRPMEGPPLTDGRHGISNCYAWNYRWKTREGASSPSSGEEKKHEKAPQLPILELQKSPIFFQDIHSPNGHLFEFASPSFVADAQHIRARSLSGWLKSGKKVFIGVADTANDRIVFLAAPLL